MLMISRRSYRNDAISNTLARSLGDSNGFETVLNQLVVKVTLLWWLPAENFNFEAHFGASILKIPFLEFVFLNSFFEIRFRHSFFEIHFEIHFQIDSVWSIQSVRSRFSNWNSNTRAQIALVWSLGPYFCYRLYPTVSLPKFEHLKL